MPWLLGLTAATFVVQTDDYMVLGIMEPLSLDLGVREAAVGQLVTVYSLVYAIGAPLLAVVVARRDKRSLLSAALAVFALANMGVLVADGYAALMTLRVVAAAAAALILPTALAVVARHAPPRARGRAMSLVMLGLTAAVVVGVPAGAYLAAVADWRLAFVMCGVVATAAGIQVLVALPRGAEERGEDRVLGPGLGALTHRPVVVLLTVTVIAVAGNLGFHTYLAPFVMAATGIDQPGFASLLVVVGLAGLAGTYASGVICDRVRPSATLLGVLTVFSASTAAMALVWTIRPIPVVALVPVLVLWSASAWGMPPAVQSALVARVGTARAAQALAFNSSAVYVGAALGSAGGGVLVSLDVGALPAVACLAGVLATVVVAVGGRGGRSNDPAPMVSA